MPFLRVKGLLESSINSREEDVLFASRASKEDSWKGIREFWF